MSGEKIEESVREGGGLINIILLWIFVSDEENRFMWNLAFVLTIKCSGVAAFTVYYTIRSFITYENIFMGPGYDHGDDSIWRSRFFDLPL